MIQLGIMKVLSYKAGIIGLVIMCGWVYGEELGVEGYDLVGYFEVGKAERGYRKYEVEHGGVMYYFMNTQRAGKFREGPEKYLPEYGGDCGYSMANGMVIKGDPKFFEIEGGKLYMFANKRAQDQWNKDRLEYIRKGMENWGKLERR